MEPHFRSKALRQRDQVHMSSGMTQQAVEFQVGLAEADKVGVAHGLFHITDQGA